MMAFLLLSTTLASVALAVGAITDLRRREVPDWVNYGLFSAAVALRIIAAVTEHHQGYLTEGLLGFGVMAALAYLLFYSGQMGGGDAKLLMAMGMLLGLPWNLSAAIDSMLLAFMLNSLIVGAVYGLLWSAGLAIRHHAQIAQSFRRAFSHPPLRTIRKWGMALSIPLLVYVIFFATPQMKILLLALLLVYLVMLYSYVFIRAVEETCMLKQVPVSKLTVGDWIPKDVIVSGKRIVGPKDLGIGPEQLATLRKLAKQRKIKTVLVKEGVPFVPSFLLAYLATLVWGNLLFLLFSL